MTGEHRVWLVSGVGGGPDLSGSLQAAVTAAYVLINGDGDRHRPPSLAGTSGSLAVAEVSDDAREALH